MCVLSSLGVGAHFVPDLGKFRPGRFRICNQLISHTYTGSYVMLSRTAADIRYLRRRLAVTYKFLRKTRRIKETRKG